MNYEGLRPHSKSCGCPVRFTTIFRYSDMNYHRLAKVISLGIGVLTATAFWTGRSVFLGKLNAAHGIIREGNMIRSNPTLYLATKKGNSFGTSHGCILRPQTFAKSNITRQRSGIDVDSSKQCTLQWNQLKLNITNYESDINLLPARRQINHDRNHTPPLLYGDPQMKLNLQSYLLPDLIWGPNNQLFGFMDSVFMAIHLNRTLVLPSFLKHKTDR